MLRSVHLDLQLISRIFLNRNPSTPYGTQLSDTRKAQSLNCRITSRANSCDSRKRLWKETGFMIDLTSHEPHKSHIKQPHVTSGKSQVTSHTSKITHHTVHIAHQTSQVTHHKSWMNHKWKITCQISQFTCHSSHAKWYVNGIHHTSCVTSWVLV